MPHPTIYGPAFQVEVLSESRVQHHSSLTVEYIVAMLLKPRTAPWYGRVVPDGTTDGTGGVSGARSHNNNDMN